MHYFSTSAKEPESLNAQCQALLNEASRGGKARHELNRDLQDFAATLSNRGPFDEHLVSKTLLEFNKRTLGAPAEGLIQVLQQCSKESFVNTIFDLFADLSNWSYSEFETLYRAASTMVCTEDFAKLSLLFSESSDRKGKVLRLMACADEAATIDFVQREFSREEDMEVKIGMTSLLQHSNLPEAFHALGALLGCPELADDRDMLFGAIRYSSGSRCDGLVHPGVSFVDGPLSPDMNAQVHEYAVEKLRQIVAEQESNVLVNCLGEWGAAAASKGWFSPGVIAAACFDSDQIEDNFVELVEKVNRAVLEVSKSESAEFQSAMCHLVANHLAYYGPHLEAKHKLEENDSSTWLLPDSKVLFTLAAQILPLIVDAIEKNDYSNFSWISGMSEFSETLNKDLLMAFALKIINPNLHDCFKRHYHVVHFDGATPLDHADKAFLQIFPGGSKEMLEYYYCQFLGSPEIVAVLDRLDQQLSEGVVSLNPGVRDPSLADPFQMTPRKHGTFLGAGELFSKEVRFSPVLTSIISYEAMKPYMTYSGSVMLKWRFADNGDHRGGIEDYEIFCMRSISSRLPNFSSAIAKVVQGR